MDIAEIDGAQPGDRQVCLRIKFSMNTQRSDSFYHHLLY